MARRVAEHLDVAFCGIEQAEKEFDGCGLAGAVGPQKAEDFAAAHFKVDVVDRLGFWPSPKVFEYLREPFDRDDVFHSDDSGSHGRLS